MPHAATHRPGPPLALPSNARTRAHTPWQLFELLLTLSGSARYQKLLAPALPELAALCVSYSQMSSDQEETWMDDPNALIADEESEFVGCRYAAGAARGPRPGHVPAAGARRRRRAMCSAAGGSRGGRRGGGVRGAVPSLHTFLLLPGRPLICSTSLPLSLR
jgi:hypothetical protein